MEEEINGKFEEYKWNIIGGRGKKIVFNLRNIFLGRNLEERKGEDFIFEKWEVGMEIDIRKMKFRYYL